MNCPTDEEIKKLCESYNLGSWMVDFSNELIDLIKAKNPEPKIDWVEGYDYYAKDFDGTWNMYMLHPDNDMAEDEWLCNYHQMPGCNGYVMITDNKIINKLNDLTKGKPWQECLIKKPGATE